MVAFLSRIWLNPLRQQGRRLLGNPHAMHAAVLGGIPAQPVNERILWRVDADEPRRPGLVVLTQSPPSWEHLTEQAGWPSSNDPDDPQVTIRPYERLLRKLANGQQFAFRLTANPVEHRRRPMQPTKDQIERAQEERLARSARLGHRTVEHQTQWLLQRAGRLGFEVPPASSSEAAGEQTSDLRVVGRARRSFRRGDSSGQVSLQVVTYEGRLRVTDADALRSSMLAGIGPAKAYGCGLLTLAPLSDGAERDG